MSKVSGAGDGDGRGARWTLREQTESHDGKPGNRNLLFAAGMGTGFRTEPAEPAEPAEVIAGRGEPLEEWEVD